uniref:HAT C-terminal dimerisation domain-containing protein n=1 Tax=Amphimedon queenslandica TaxID=400682 RepID=A0A1X7V6H8_AMPQE
MIGFDLPENEVKRPQEPVEDCEVPVEAAKWFTVIADEVTDVSDKEIISIVLRYVNSETLIIHKDLVGFFESDTGITGRALSVKITATSKDFHLNLFFLCGQGYVGAVNLQGECLDIVTAVQEIVEPFQMISVNVVSDILYCLYYSINVEKMCEVTGLSLLPSAMTKMSKEAFTQNILKLSDFYGIDLPSPGSMNSEVECLKLKWEQHLSTHGPSSLPNSLMSTLALTSSMYPNIETLLIILCTLPVTSCSAERSFSSLKRMKTPYRSTMTTHRLSRLSLLHVHRDIKVDIEAAVDEFSRRHPQRLQVANILQDE